MFGTLLNLSPEEGDCDPDASGEYRPYIQFYLNGAPLPQVNRLLFAKSDPSSDTYTAAGSFMSFQHAIFNFGAFVL